MPILSVKSNGEWHSIPAIKGDPGDPAADESITDDMLVTDGIKTEIEWLWGNQLMDSREGEILHAEDAYTAPAVDISLDGKSTQATTTGKNLLNPTTKTLVLEEPMPAGTTLTASCAGNTGQVRYYDVDDRQIDYWTTKAVSGSSRYAVSFTLLQDTYSFKWVDITSACKERQLELGSSATAYEPYTGGKASPNPDYPQEIESVDEPTLAFAGKNILDPSFLTQCGWTESNGTYTGTPKQLYQGLASHKLPVACAPNTQYVFAWYQISTTNTTNANALAFRFVYSDGTQSADRYTDLVHTLTAISAENKTVTALLFSYVSNPTLVVKCVQLVPLVAWNGSVEENYQPYIASTTVSLLPDGYSLRSLPDGTKDELHLSYLRPSKREGWAWYSRELVKRVGYEHITQANYYSTINDKPYARCDFDGGKEYVNSEASNCYSDKFINWPYSGAAFIEKQYAFKCVRLGTADDSRRFMAAFIILDHTQTSLSDFNAAITAMGGFDIQFELENYTTETLDPIELPIMPSQTVNVWSDPATNLKMTYIQDSNLIIENLEATIADIAMS